MEAPDAVPLDKFWAWLLYHPNCILRAGTPETVLYDDEDLHWHFANEPDGRLLVQVIRGKQMMGELFVDPDLVTYVQAVPSDIEGEHLFELISEATSDRVAPYFFVMAHGLEDELPAAGGRVH